MLRRAVFGFVPSLREGAPLWVNRVVLEIVVTPTERRYSPRWCSGGHREELEYSTKITVLAGILSSWC